MSKKIKFKKILKWAAVAVCLVFIVGVLFLMFYGVPKPPAITTEGVPRVPWKPLLQASRMVKQIRSSKGFAAWFPSDRRMLIYAASRLTPQLHVLSEPAGQPKKLMSVRDMPQEIRFNPDANKNYFVFSMDVDGNERYQLYRFNLSDNTYYQFTDGNSINIGGYFNARGDLFAYISSRSLGHETDIHIIDPTHPEGEKIVYQARRDFRAGCWSPAGNQILVREYISSEKSRLHILDLETGEMKELFPKETSNVYYGSAVWSKDGKSIYFVSDKDSEFWILKHLDSYSLGGMGLHHITGWQIPGDKNQ
jgi:Tol biopolymer transport system component